MIKSHLPSHMGHSRRAPRVLIAAIGLGVSLMTLGWNVSRLDAAGCDPVWVDIGETPPTYTWECYALEGGGYDVRLKIKDGTRSQKLQSPCEPVAEDTRECTLSYEVSGPTIEIIDDEEVSIYTLTPTDSCGEDGEPITTQKPPACDCYPE